MAVTSYPPRDPFYDSTVRWPNVEWQDDPLNTGFQYGEQNREAAWTKKLSEFGFGGTDAKSAFARSLYGRMQEGYKAANLNAPGYYWQHYLRDMLTPDKINAEWLGQSPTMRGENTATWAPNTRRMRRA